MKLEHGKSNENIKKREETSKLATQIKLRREQKSEIPGMSQGNHFEAI